MIEPFVYVGAPSRVVFGRGAISEAAAEASRLGITKALVLSTPQQEGMARKLADGLDGVAVGLFAGAAMHTPVEVTERALAEMCALGADGLVAIGGGPPPAWARPSPCAPMPRSWFCPPPTPVPR